MTSSVFLAATRLPFAQMMPLLTSCWTLSEMSSFAASTAKRTGRRRAASSRVRSMPNQCPCHWGCASTKVQAVAQSLKTHFITLCRGAGDT